MKNIFIAIIFAATIVGCSSGPEPLKLNKDNCASCKMSISDAKFATEAVNDKGRVYKFDDVKCMLQFVKADAAFKGTLYVVPTENPALFVVAKDASFVKSDSIKSPMGGNILAYESKQAAEVAARAYGVNVVDWKTIAE